MHAPYREECGGVGGGGVTGRDGGKMEVHGKLESLFVRIEKDVHLHIQFPHHELNYILYDFRIEFV